MEKVNLSFLVISTDEAWSAFFAGRVEGDAVETANDLAFLPDGTYDIIVLDASITVHPAPAVQQVVMQYTDSYVVVVAADPSGKEATAVLIAGAKDYVIKGYNEEDLTALLSDISERYSLD